MKQLCFYMLRVIMLFYISLPIWPNINAVCTAVYCGPSSSVDIATDYGLDGPGSNPGGDEIFPPVQTGPGAHPASCTVGTLGVKCGRGVLLITHPF